MTCSKHQLIIDDIGDIDRLPPESARHVDECSACAEFARNLVSLRALLREQGRISAPPDFDAGLARRIRAARTPARASSILDWFAVPQRMLASAAAFALVAAGAFAVATYESGPRGQASPQVATNQSISLTEAASNESAVSTFHPPTDPAGPSDAALVNTIASRSTPRNTSRRQSLATRLADQGDALLLVQDSEGARIVNVPRVLVGAERIVPQPQVDSAIAALDDRMAF